MGRAFYKMKGNRRWLKITHRIPKEGKHSEGRQNLRWLDEITKLAAVRWPQLAQDRVNGRGMVMAGLW